MAQIPVFIGLFYTLRARLPEDICPASRRRIGTPMPLHHNIPLKQAVGHTTACHGLNGSSWLFIHDLTNTATGLTLVVLIVLYVGTQLASSLMMRAPTMDPTQRRMLLLLPLFFVIFIISLPAGLTLYWITTNAWTMGQQWVIRRRIGPVAPVTPVAPAAASGGRGDRRAATTANEDGSGGGGGLSRLLRGKPKPEESSSPPVGRARAHGARRGRRLRHARGRSAQDAGTSSGGIAPYDGSPDTPVTKAKQARVPVVELVSQLATSAHPLLGGLLQALSRKQHCGHTRADAPLMPS